MKLNRAALFASTLVVVVASLAVPALGADGETPVAISAEEPSRAPPRSDLAAYTQYVVQQAIDRYDAEGREATIAHHNSPESVDGPWYVFIVNADGILISHALRPDLVGTSTAMRRDVNGKAYGQEIVAATEGGRWVDYFFTDPLSGEVEQKHTWVVRHDGLFFASGWYSPDDPDAPPKVNQPAYTKYLVQRAIDRYDTQGRDHTIAYHNSPESVDGEWYVFIFTEAAGTYVAHPTRPDLLGTDVSELVDVNGKAFGTELAAADRNGVWVDHHFARPQDGEPTARHAWAVAHDGFVFSAGWDESGEAPPRSDVATYTQYVVQQAIDRYEAEGREATVAHHNSPESVDGQWYVFIIDEAGISIAHPTRPDILGTNRAVATDVNGKLYGPELLAATENGRWVDYYFTHPETGDPERKHTWVVRHDGLLFASGWYRLPGETPADPGPAPDAATG